MNGDGGGAMIAGIFMMVLGVALTVLSYATASPGGTYFIFVGLMAGGFVTFIRGLATPSAGGYSRGGRVRSTGRAGYETHAGPAQVPRENYVALPGMMPAGYCWACGRKVRKGNIICYGCGAAQVAAPPAEPSAASQPEMPYEGGTYGGAYAGSRQPGMPNPGAPSPGASYPGGPYPGMPYPRNPYPGMPYHDSPYPGRSYPGNRYPSGPYPGTPSPRRPRSRGPRPNAPSR
jgi:hypothetical protein